MLQVCTEMSYYKMLSNLLALLFLLKD